MAPTLPQFNPARLRSYLLRLPLFTRLILLLVVTLWLASLQSVWDVAQWGALIPKEVGLSTMYRLNTYPLIHVNFLHGFLNALALTPLLERFESEHGTLTTAALLAGRGLYLLFERGIWRGNNAIMGASEWVFVFLAVEAIKAYRANPYLTASISTYQIPTWTTPAIITLLVTFLIPNTSLLGHLCALSVGYLFGLGYLKILAPPEKILRWIEGKMNLLGRLPHYVSVDQKTYGRVYAAFGAMIHLLDWLYVLGVKPTARSGNALPTPPLLNRQGGSVAASDEPEECPNNYMVGPMVST